MDTTCRIFEVADFRKKRTSFGPEDAEGHVGAARRGLILLLGFFIVDTDRFVPEANNYRGRSIASTSLMKRQALCLSRYVAFPAPRKDASRNERPIIRMLVRRNTRSVSPRNAEIFAELNGTSPMFLVAPKANKLSQDYRRHCVAPETVMKQDDAISRLINL